MAIAASFPNLRPSLLLDFANSKTVDSRVTFTRSTTAKYYDSISTAKAEENLLTYSQEFDDASWTKNNLSVSANNQAAPDGTTTAETLTANAFTGQNVRVRRDAVIASTFTMSVFAKAGTHSVICIQSSNPGSANNWAGAVFDLSAGTVTQTGAGSSSTLVSSSITSFGNSWYRCVITVTLATYGTPAHQVVMLNNTTGNSTGSFGFDPNVTFAGTETVFIWGAQLEARSQATAYTPTTTQPITNYIPVLQTAAAGVPRIDHDPVTGECLGLLIEEQRTNLMTWSESFRTQTLAVTGVSGTFVDGETVTATGGGTGTYVLAESTGSSFAIFNGSGTFTGTLTGGTSGATATISSSVAAWTPLGTTVTANTIVSPDGTLTGDKLYEDTGNTVHRITQAPITATSTTYTISVYAKAAERAFLLLRDASQGVGVWFNLSTGSVGTQNAGITGSITDVGNGWYRCSATRTTAVINTLWGIQVANSDASNTYTGDGYSGIYIWGAQLE